MIIGLYIIFVILGLYLAFAIAHTQNVAISECFELKRLHDGILTGMQDLSHISDRRLLQLSQPKMTHVGMGGVGPSYYPSFEVLMIVKAELSRRRQKQKKVIHNE